MTAIEHAVQRVRNITMLLRPILNSTSSEKKMNIIIDKNIDKASSIAIILRTLRNDDTIATRPVQIVKYKIKLFRKFGGETKAV